LVYDQLDFEVPLGSRGDNYDRFLCRIREIEQSMKIVEQALEQLPVGPVWIDDPRLVLPEKEKVYGSIEGLMHHFKIIMEGIHVPAGETYFAVEGGNGELGFYVVSDGGGKPYRLRVRPPCFIAMGAFREMIQGHMLADIIPTFGMINMIGGECDR
jgi:NADH-quinone oxidoreductase subunit D